MIYRIYECTGKGYQKTHDHLDESKMLHIMDHIVSGSLPGTRTLVVGRENKTDYITYLYLGQPEDYKSFKKSFDKPKVKTLGGLK